MGKKLLKKMLPNMYFTRVELAFDFIGHHIEDLIYYKPGARSFKTHMTVKYDAGGRIETIYLNSPRSRFYIIIYDRKKKINKERAKNNMALMEQDITRVEFVRKSGQYYVNDLLDYQFPEIALYMLTDQELSMLFKEWKNWSELQIITFKDSCRCRGLNNVIKCLPKKNQRAFKYKLDKLNPLYILKDIYEEKKDASLTKLKLLFDMD